MLGGNDTEQRQPPGSTEQPGSTRLSGADAQGSSTSDAQGAASQLPAITIPKGGGAIRGIGEKFATNPVTGSGSMTIPLALSPGRSGFGPQLSLSYDSGNGNGPFGFGWSLSSPSITRKTDRGLPQYLDAQESDVFLLSGAEDLVPLLLADGSRHADTTSHPGFTIRRFRPRVEGLFARIEQWTENASNDVHWRSITRDNVTTIYGRNNDSRIFDPAETNLSHPQRVFEWLICESFDDKGNAIVYDYAAENDTRVNLARMNERNRVRTANRYLKRIRYGNRVSRLVQTNLSDAEWLFEVVFDYDEEHYSVLPLDPTRPEAEQHRFVQACSESNGAWRVRPDPFSVYRPGYEVRTYRRCHRVLMFHRFAELGPEPCLVRATEFDYADLVDYESDAPPSVSDELGQQGSARHASFIRRVVQSGYVRDEENSPEERDGLRYFTYLHKSLPPLEFEYTSAEIQDEVRGLDESSGANLPRGVDGSFYQWVDLDGEGLSGILTRQSDSWHYKPNLGNGHFGSIQTLCTQPSLFAHAAGAEQMLDLSGDGQLDVVAFEGSTPGYYERTTDRGWDPFRHFQQLPNIRWDDPNLRFVDLSGDGHADVLVTEHEAFTWFPSLREDGFDSARRVHTPLDENAGPRLVFADADQSIYLADMSGDGLTDLVRIRNGEACYWPNLGYGRFGAKVAMDNAPWFDHPDQFSNTRIRLADIDGSGTSDILYLGSDSVRIYFNLSGNGCSEARVLSTFPPLDNLASVTTTDLFGNGTACLVWSSPLPADVERPLRFIDLMGGHKPHLLTTTVNNLGAETHVTYAPSTKFYLQDKRNGKPWITRIPFPVHVVERVETYDRISRNRFVTCYTYHHGYFDGHEREFRGFGLVEQYDTEEFAALSKSNQFPQGANIDAASHVPPVLTKTWFHTGVYLGRTHVSNYFAGLLDAHDTGEYFREPGLTDVQARELLLGDTILPDGLTVDEEREACRALRGSVLRQEIYALDNSDKKFLPYSVTESNYGVKRIQGRGENRHAVFLRHAREELVYQYERTLVPVLGEQIVDAVSVTANPDITLRLDPRVAQSLTLEVDEFGNVLKTASVSYGRRFCDTALPTVVQDLQAKMHLTLTENRVTNPIDNTDAYRTPLPSESRTWELTGYTPSGTAGRFCAEDLVAVTVTKPAGYNALFDDELNYEELPTGGRQRRLIEHIRTVFRRDDLVGPLPLGHLEPRALPYESYKLALTPGLVDLVFNTGDTAIRVSTDMLAGTDRKPGCRYVHTQDETGAVDTNWWIPSGRVFFSSRTEDTAALELEHARRHFFLPHRSRNAFHTASVPTESFVTYDHYDLMVRETRDPLDNRLTVGERHSDPIQPLNSHGQNYRVLQPALVMDPNRNRTALAFDALGMVTGTAVMGKPEDKPAQGDRLTTEFRPDLTAAELDAFLATPKGPIAAQLLADATTRIITDLLAYVREPDIERKPPAVAATLARETHTSDPLPPEGLRLQTSIAYSDGFGREVQRKVQAEAGQVPKRDSEGSIVLDDRNHPQLTPDEVNPRWVTTGWTVFNNKGKPVRQFEPYFTDRHGFEFDARIGNSPVLFYDPIARVVATLHPNRTWEKVVFSPWKQVSWDVCDTVLVAAPDMDVDAGDYFARLPGSNYTPTWHALRTDAANIDALTTRYPNNHLRENEQAAARQSEVHAHTPSVAHADAMGRTILTVAHNRFQRSDEATPTEEFYSTRNEFDIEGNQREITDAKGRLVVRYNYDMLGNRLHQSSMEAGERWILSDVAGKPVYAWNSRGYRSRIAYDALQRPTDSFLLEGDDPEVLVGRSIYGEARKHTELNNLRGQLVELYDQAGLVTSDSYDFKGNLLTSARQFVDTVLIDGKSEPGYRHQIDWYGVVTLMDEKYASHTQFDALNRPILQVAPHSDQPDAKVNITQPTYNEANLLERLTVWLGQSSVPSSLIDSSVVRPSPVGVTDIDYDAKGQRQKITYSNGVSTRYRYDPETYRLVQLRTQSEGSKDLLQSLHYTFDAAGNITHIRDNAQQTQFFANTRVEPHQHYLYDSLFRLIEATGREHLGQSGGAPIPHSHNDAPRVGRIGIPDPNDGHALGRYIERYTYDSVGNILSMRHSGSNTHHSGWKRDYAYDEPSQLEPEIASNRLTSTTISKGSSSTSTYSMDGEGYDDHGNMLNMPHLQIMKWNPRDQLEMAQRQVVNQSDKEGILRQGEQTWYVYDAVGQRIRKVTEMHYGHVKEERIYLGVFEAYRNPTLDLVRETLHVADDKQRIALVETRVAGNEPGLPRRLVRYQLSNHLESSSIEVDEKTRVFSYEEYTPYGSTAYQAVRSQLRAPKRYRFTGMERDDESGLGFHSARYYAPWLGRWINTDPLGLVDGTNLYRYARNQPVKLTDRAGTDPDPRNYQQRSINANLNYDSTSGSVSYSLTVELQNPETGDWFHYTSHGDASGLQTLHYDLQTNTGLTDALTLEERESLFLSLESFADSIETANLALQTSTDDSGGPDSHGERAQESSEESSLDRGLRIVGDVTRGVSADRALPQQYRLEPARGATITGIRDTRAGPSRGNPPRPVGRPVIRVDRPHGSTKYPHINVETLTPDPHHRISPGALTTAGRLATGIESIGRVARPVAIVTDTVRLGAAVYEDEGIGENTARTAASVAGGWAGAFAGAWAGAKGGAALGGLAGSVVPGLGNAAGAAIGGLVGGLIGGIAGGFLGSWAAESAADKALE